MIKHFLSLKDYNKNDINEIIRLSIEIKHNFLNGKRINPTFKDKILAMIFQKSSTRTRVSFEVGAYQLGGSAIFLSDRDIQLGRGESIKDTSRVISSMVDMVMIRTFKQEMIEEFAKYSNIPVINGLSDEFHPTQLIADYITMIENGITMDITAPYAKPKSIREPIVAYIGDGNNMAHSYINLASKLGFTLKIASPKGYEVDFALVSEALKCPNITISNDPKEAINGANVVVTDTWVSMGQEEEKEARIKAFAGFCIDSTMMKLAKDDAIFLHCLPAYRGYEVSEDVIESAKSRVFQEAENRLHAQKGIISFLGNENWKK